MKSSISKEAIDAHLATKMVKQTPRNLLDLPSAHDVSPERAPMNIYHKSSLARANMEAMIDEENRKKSSSR